MNVRILGVCAAAVCVLLASGCGTQKNSGKYYDRDGPPKEWETFGMSRADAVPKVEKPIGKLRCKNTRHCCMRKIRIQHHHLLID